MSDMGASATPPAAPAPQLPPACAALPLPPLQPATSPDLTARWQVRGKRPSRVRSGAEVSPRDASSSGRATPDVRALDAFPRHIFDDVTAADGRALAGPPQQSVASTSASRLPKWGGGTAAQTYSRHSPAPPRPPSAGRPRQLKQGRSVRDLGRELIQQHVRAQYEGAPAGDDATLLYEPDLPASLPPGMQSILDAYTRIAGDVERLTAIPAAPPRRGNVLDAYSRNHASKERFSTVPTRAGKRLHGSAPATAASTSAHAAGRLPARGAMQPRASSERHADAPPQGGASAGNRPAGGFGLSSVMQDHKPQMRRIQYGAACAEQQPAGKPFGLAGVLKSSGHKLASKPPLATSPTAKARRPGDTFDEGSWIYIMGTSTNSAKAKSLAQQQRARIAASAR